MATLLHRCNRIYMTRVRYRQSCGLDIWSVLLPYLFVSRIAWRVLAFVFALVLFFPSPPIRSGEAFSSVIFPLFLFFHLFFGCSDGMEREACVCDHGLERSDLCAEIIIAAAELGRFPLSKHQIQPEYGDEQADAGQNCRTRLARPNSQARTRTRKYLFSLFS